MAPSWNPSFHTLVSSEYSSLRHYEWWDCSNTTFPMRLLNFVHSRLLAGKRPFNKSRNCSAIMFLVLISPPITNAQNVRTDLRSLLCQFLNGTWYRLWFACPPGLQNQRKWRESLAILLLKLIQIVNNTLKVARRYMQIVVFYVFLRAMVCK